MRSYLSSGMAGEPIYRDEPGRSGIWIRAIALMRNQKSVPAPDGRRKSAGGKAPGTASGAFLAPWKGAGSIRQQYRDARAPDARSPAPGALDGRASA